MSDLISRQDAIDAVHYYIESGYKCDIFQEVKDLPSEPERTAKVEWYPHLTKLADGHCECGEDVRDDWKYCPNCGCKLEWK